MEPNPGFDRYSDASDDKSYRKLEQEPCTILSV